MRTTSATKESRIRHRSRPPDDRADHRGGTFRASGATVPPPETGPDIGRTIAASEVTDTMGYAPHSSPTPRSNIKILTHVCSLARPHSTCLRRVVPPCPLRVRPTTPRRHDSRRRESTGPCVHARIGPEWPPSQTPTVVTGLARTTGARSACARNGPAPFRLAPNPPWGPSQANRAALFYLNRPGYELPPGYGGRRTLVHFPTRKSQRRP